MNKILRPKNLPTVVLIAGILAAALRIWTIGGGPDAAGLYPRQPVAWNLLWLLTVLRLPKLPSRMAAMWYSVLSFW